ncbi:MAG: MBOAT family protein [Bacteroidaceae bacterium]|nr:MBOAT family protein [Bacteroidaceae bacterium]
MLFNSIDYFFFLTFVFFVYWATRNLKVQNLFIVGASYFFYACWDWRFLSLILVTTLCSWESGLLMERFGKNKRACRMIMTCNVVLNLIILGFFKYFNFFADSFSALLASVGINADFPTLNIILPVGISFYTFQAIGYSIDVFCRRLNPCRDLVCFASFICFFPQLVAGPIEPASHLLPQFQQPRRFRYEEAVKGSRMILWGLFKKMIVADNCAPTVDMVWNDYTHFSPVMLAVASLLFTIQIYCDFSGYSDIAIGSAKLFGIDLINNFKMPYFSTSIPEFWRRWHISLMNWFRTYIYIPLGGSRRGKAITIRNVFVVFLLSGLWHGANYTFIVWGLYHALLSMVYVLFDIKTKNTTDMSMFFMRHIPSILLTFLLVNIGWIIFRAPDLQSAIGYLSNMLTQELTFADFSGITAILTSIICLAVEWVQRNHEYTLDFGNSRLFASPCVRAIVYYTILIALFELSARQESFIYFQF